MSDRPMKQLAVEDLAPDAHHLIDQMRRNRILLTRKGKPFALVVTIEHLGDNYDAEDFDYMTDPEFWKMIQERRRETKYLTLEEVKARLEADEAAERASRKIRSKHPVQKG